jgi:hypothetical protein
MPVTTYDIAGPWAAVGRQLFQGGNSYEMGRTKMGQALAQEAQANAHARLFNEQADQIAQRRGYQAPEFASKIAAALAGLSDAQGVALSDYQQQGHWGALEAPAPSWYSPDVERRVNNARGAFLANLAGTGNSNAEQIAEAYAKVAGQGRIDSAMGRPETIPVFGQAMAASQGKPLFHQGAHGTMNQFTGAENLNDVGRSAAMENRAQAGNASASAALHRAQIPEVAAKIEVLKSKVGQTDPATGEKKTPPPKPIPAAALKLQQEELDAIGTASNLEKDIGALSGMIDQGKLLLGPAENVKSNLRNMAGMSDDNSRNFASFRAMLERLRNDSLRLNKGVQTEGDAQRAWNELVANINDPKVVRQRLEEIQRVNQRAVALRKNNVDVIRANYGHPELDVSGYTGQEATLGPKPGGGGVDDLLKKYGGQ